jgi:hypothetical protein
MTLLSPGRTETRPMRDPPPSFARLPSTSSTSCIVIGRPWLSRCVLVEAVSRAPSDPHVRRSAKPATRAQHAP